MAEIIDLSSDSDSEPQPSDQPVKENNEQSVQSIPQDAQQTEAASVHTEKKNEGYGKEKTSKHNKGSKRFNLLSTSKEFMENFNPEKSNREKRKLTQKFDKEPRKSGYSHGDDGVILGSGLDLCDCLVESCIGCFFPCPSCRSAKCGSECRVNRKCIIESVESEADGTIRTNPAIIKAN